MSTCRIPFCSKVLQLFSRKARLFLVFRYHSEDLWCSIACFRKWVKIYQSTCRCTPPRNEKVGSQVNMTFWFWMMYPPQEWKSWISGQGDIFGSRWCTPPPLIDWNKHECYRKLGSASTFYQSTPLQYNLILCLNRKLVNFNFNWIWIHRLKPHPPSLSSPKIEMLVFGLRSTSDDWPGWSMDSNPICHPSPAQRIKCSFLDYVQLLMIGWAIQAKNVDQNAKKWKRPPKSSENQMFIFRLHSTSDDRTSDASKKCWLKCKKTKKAPKSLKNKMSIFFYYVQLLMIGQVIQAKNIDQNVKKWKRPPKSLKNKMFIFKTAVHSWQRCLTNHYP